MPDTVSHTAIMYARKWNMEYPDPLTPAIVLMPGHFSFSWRLSGLRNVTRLSPSFCLVCPLHLFWSWVLSFRQSLSNPNILASSTLVLIQPIVWDRRGITAFYCELGRLTAVLWQIIRLFTAPVGWHRGSLLGDNWKTKRKSGLLLRICSICASKNNQACKQTSIYSKIVFFFYLEAWENFCQRFTEAHVPHYLTCCLYHNYKTAFSQWHFMDLCVPQWGGGAASCTKLITLIHFYELFR